MFALGSGSQNNMAHHGIPLGTTAHGPSGRHGSTEHGSSTRGRSSRGHSSRGDRSRERSDNGSQPVLGTVIRSGPAGPQERQEWMDALADCKERISTLETNNRNLAQRSAEHDHKFKIVGDDIAAYK